eukprot:TRINITY_DN25136_c0_g1_i1.p1 TRINITY_DN25136_c0_g1~~TRINITY_DN25136_c0_g1_i1.p1  ORF type:complete len:500 (+),score=96.91 TRINITY_DN25136_c0_g1_i1:106-1500(+)
MAPITPAVPIPPPPHIIPPRHPRIKVAGAAAPAPDDGGERFGDAMRELLRPDEASPYRPKQCRRRRTPPGGREPRHRWRSPRKAQFPEGRLARLGEGVRHACKGWQTAENAPPPAVPPPPRRGRRPYFAARTRAQRRAVEKKINHVPSTVGSYPPELGETVCLRGLWWPRTEKSGLDFGEYEGAPLYSSFTWDRRFIEPEVRKMVDRPRPSSRPCPKKALERATLQRTVEAMAREHVIFFPAAYTSLTARRHTDRADREADGRPRTPQPRRSSPRSFLPPAADGAECAFLWDLNPAAVGAGVCRAPRRPRSAAAVQCPRASFADPPAETVDNPSASPPSPRSASGSAPAPVAPRPAPPAPEPSGRCSAARSQLFTPQPPHVPRPPPLAAAGAGCHRGVTPAATSRGGGSAELPAPLRPGSARSGPTGAAARTESTCAPTPGPVSSAEQEGTADAGESRYRTSPY